MKVVSSFDRIKSDLEMRGAMPGSKPSNNWEVVPVVRSVNQLNNQSTSTNQY